MQFELYSKFKPTGDQSKAIKKLVDGYKKGYSFQTLLGVTGSGKTFSIANFIQEIQKPALIISHNKCLAAQTFQEFKSFFPKNAVHYFVSFYDYYQPEAYIPQTDTYIAKDAKINEEIDRLRHAAVQAVLTRKDVVIVASVSCIYNLGSPVAWQNLHLEVQQGQTISRKKFFEQLLDIQYERNDYDFCPGRFRVRSEFVDIWSPSGEKIYRIKFGPERITDIFVTRKLFEEFKPVKKISIFPAKFWLSEKARLNTAIANIELELKQQLKKLKKENKILEAERLRRRTRYDLSLLKEMGWCPGIENYSRHLEFRRAGSPPFCLLDYFRQAYKNDFITVIDESHMTISQIRGMYQGDMARKRTLVENGFRLPSALDNRPLRFDEFLQKIGQTVFMSATPGNFEKQKSAQIVEQIIRPTYLLDPTIEIRKTKNQIKELVKEIEKRVKKNQRVLVTVLTKRLSEALSNFLKEKNIKAAFLHSEIKTLQRPYILRKLRRGEYDVIVGINLLREGLDLPEVSLIAILDADKESFLRDTTSLIQVMGRASRHPDGHVIMFADKITGSMKQAIQETERRRKIQFAYNKKHGLQPKPIQKEIREILVSEKEEERIKIEKISHTEYQKEYLKELKAKLDLAQRNLQFEKAAQIAEKIERLKRLRDREIERY